MRVVWYGYNPECLEIGRKIGIWSGTGLETSSNKKKVKSRESKKGKSRDLLNK